MDFHTFNLNESPQDIDIHQYEIELQSNDVEVIVTNVSDDYNIIDLNVGGSEMVYPLLEININDMYEGDDNIEQQGESEEEIEEDGGAGEYQNVASSGNFETFENRRSHQMLTNKQKEMVYNILLQRSVNGKLKKMDTKEISNLLKLPLRTIQRIWKIHKSTPYGIPVDVSHKKTRNCSRKRVQIDLSRVSDIPLSQRTTLRSFVAALGVQQSTLVNILREGLIRRHTNAIRPHLKEENKISRLEFCMSMIDRITSPQEPKFIGMFNYIHIDKKWFYMTKKSEKYYLLPSEEEPLRTCQSKNYIGKVMFLVAMARPRFDTNGNEIFSGKIGVFPFVKMVEAQRRSRNRDAGTFKTFSIIQQVLSISSSNA